MLCKVATFEIVCILHIFPKKLKNKKAISDVPKLKLERRFTGAGHFAAVSGSDVCLLCLAEEEKSFDARAVL